MSGKWLGVSPREAWLEIEYSRLSAEVRWLRQSKGLNVSYLTDHEPTILDICSTGSTLHLSAHAAMREEHGLNLHVYVSEVTKDGAGIKYFCTPGLVRSTQERAAIMADMHDKLVFNIGRHLWSGEVGGRN